MSHTTLCHTWCLIVTYRTWHWIKYSNIFTYDSRSKSKERLPNKIQINYHTQPRIAKHPIWHHKDEVKPIIIMTYAWHSKLEMICCFIQTTSLCPKVSHQTNEPYGRTWQHIHFANDKCGSKYDLSFHTACPLQVEPGLAFNSHTTCTWSSLASFPSHIWQSWSKWPIISHMYCNFQMPQFYLRLHTTTHRSPQPHTTRST